MVAPGKKENKGITCLTTTISPKDVTEAYIYMDDAVLRIEEENNQFSFQRTHYFVTGSPVYSNKIRKFPRCSLVLEGTDRLPTPRVVHHLQSFPWC